MHFEFCVPLLSLTDADGQPLPGLISAHLEWLKQAGCRHVLVLGTTGEFPSLSVVRRQAYLEAVLAANPGLNVMVNIGTSNLADTQALHRHALASGGVNRILLMPPFYFPGPAINGFTEYVERILDDQPQGMPFYLYHYPKTSQVHILPELLDAFPAVTGIKDTSGQLAHVAQWLERFPDREIHVGTDWEISQCMQAGATGIISGLGNLFPALYRAAILGDSAAQQKLQKIRAVFDTVCKLPAMKAYLNHLNPAHTHPTYPLLPMRALRANEFAPVFQAIQAIIQ